jgi:hypothetical protein
MNVLEAETARNVKLIPSVATFAMLESPLSDTKVLPSGTKPAEPPAFPMSQSPPACPHVSEPALWLIVPDAV